MLLFPRCKMNINFGKLGVNTKQSDRGGNPSRCRRLEDTNIAQYSPRFVRYFTRGCKSTFLLWKILYSLISFSDVVFCEE